MKMRTPKTSKMKERPNSTHYQSNAHRLTPLIPKILSRLSL
jgi:hypothetical protein